MESKTNNPLIYSAMSNIMRDVPAIGKSQKSTQNYMYRGIDDMYNELHELFVKHNVFLISEIISSQREERTTAKGGLLIYSILRVKFTFFAEDGSSVSSIIEGEAMDSSDKSSNKAMSIALKYCLMQSFLIPTKELKELDPDAIVQEPIARQSENGYVHIPPSINESNDIATVAVVKKFDKLKF